MKKLSSQELPQKSAFDLDPQIKFEVQEQKLQVNPVELMPWEMDQDTNDVPDKYVDKVISYKPAQ